MLTDIYMPDGDGLELLMAIRRRPHSQRPAVIAMSSNTVGPKNMLHVAQQFGAKLILPKPFDAAQLQAAIDQVLSARPAPSSA